MQRITITIDNDLLEALDGYMQGRGYASRSEAVRDILRERLGSEKLRDPSAQCVGAFAYVYEHEVRALSRRLTTAHHDRHDLSVATMHVHLNHDSCLEISVLRGQLADVRAFADTVSSQRGVRSTNLHLIPAQIETHEHRHGAAPVPHQHVEI